MPIIATTQTTQGHVYILSGNDHLTVGSGVTITSINTDAVTTWTGTHVFDVSGTIRGYDDGINTIGCDTAQTVRIQSTGRIYSGGDGVIPEADGVILDGVGSTLTNAGRIESYGSAASLFVRDAGTTTVTNSGTMIGHQYGIWHKFGSGTLLFTNSGIVESDGKSFQGGNSVDFVTNKGTMRGMVDLAGGNDVYDGRGGSVVGSILGGEGDDRFVTGNAAETIDGGDGIDTLDYTTRANGVTVDLSNSANNRGTGVGGDVYTGFEDIRGGNCADKLTGDAGNNHLVGAGGTDSLLGGAGDDIIEGGLGRDYLTGGDGADRFVFNVNTGNGDYIQDFTTGVDHIVLTAAAFGYGVTTGALAAADFVVSSTNAARDASDHFIFRTTDKTLWYDADGLGGRAAVLLADLQSSASLSAADILFV